MKKRLNGQRKLAGEKKKKKQDFRVGLSWTCKLRGKVDWVIVF